MLKTLKNEDKSGYYRTPNKPGLRKVQRKKWYKRDPIEQEKMTRKFAKKLKKEYRFNDF